MQYREWKQQAPPHRRSTRLACLAFSALRVCHHQRRHGPCRVFRPAGLPSLPPPPPACPFLPSSLRAIQNKARAHEARSHRASALLTGGLALDLNGGGRRAATSFGLVEGLRVRRWLAAAELGCALQAVNGAHKLVDVILAEGERGRVPAAEARPAARAAKLRRDEGLDAARACAAADVAFLLFNAAKSFAFLAGSTARLTRAAEALAIALAEKRDVVKVAGSVAADARAHHARWHDFEQLTT